MGRRRGEPVRDDDGSVGLRDPVNVRRETDAVDRGEGHDDHGARVTVRSVRGTRT
jgi:hypothetical protein